MKLIKLTDYPFHYKIHTRWKDMDSFMHVNNAIFLTYIEDARVNLFKRWHLRDKTKSIIVASIKIDYFQQIRHPSKLNIGQKISRIGSTSFDIESAIFVNSIQDSVALSKVICVCYDYKNNKSVSVYPEIISDFSQILEKKKH